MFKKLIVWLPLLILVALASLFYKGLFLDTNKVPSPFIDKPAPALILPDLLDIKKQVNLKDWKGQVVLLNVWATWCTGCLQEHPILNAIADEKLVPIIGLNYKDNTRKAKAWLQKAGNPFVAIPNDLSGEVAINWGVYGAPETFIIDKRGIIRYKFIAPISMLDWTNKIRPLVIELQGES